MKLFLQGKVHPGEAESDVLISSVVSHLAGVHATLEEFLQTAATKPSLEFQCLPRDRYSGHFMSFWRFYHSGEASRAFALPQLFMPWVIFQGYLGSKFPLIATICGNYISVLSFYNNEYYKLDVIDRIKFLSIIITTVPGVNLENEIKWRMNQHLQNRNARDGGKRDNFFGGNQSFHFFERVRSFCLRYGCGWTKKLLEPLFPSQLLLYHDQTVLLRMRSERASLLLIRSMWPCNVKDLPANDDLSIISQLNLLWSWVFQDIDFEKF